MPNELTITIVIAIMLYILPEIIRRLRGKPPVYPPAGAEQVPAVDELDQLTVERPRKIPQWVVLEEPQAMADADADADTVIAVNAEASVNNRQLINISKKSVQQGMVWSQILARPLARERRR